jgi:D-alanyl-lipoteichoic acid acyltransferase DltB (MBOAT superfamily)
VLFPTITFAIFFLLVFTLNWLVMPRFRLWKWFTILVGYVFYAWWDWRFVGLLVVATLVNQAAAQLMGRPGVGGRKAILTVAVAADLGLLGWFKYYGFFVSSLTNVLRGVGLQPSIPLFNIVLPVGISFLTFRVLSYVIDVYRGELEPAPALDFAVYVAFFPYLLAGPIARAAEFLPQLGQPRDARRLDSARAFTLIFGGLFKKMIIADYLATHLVNGVFADPGMHSSWETLVAIYGYTVQIYCDFSAYSDIAIGLALLLGFRLPDNFNAPYAALSLRDFWRRWHMTLSRWLRDYLYIPLGGNRLGRRRTYVNLMATMLLGGLWHGAGWTFVFWGGMHGAGLTGERVRAARRAALGLPPPRDTAGRRVLQRLAVFHFVALAWVFFRADSLRDAFGLLGHLFTAWGAPSPGVTWTVVGLIALGVGVQYVPQRPLLAFQAGFSRLAPALQGVGIAFGLFVLNVLGPAGPASFLYFKF